MRISVVGLGFVGKAIYDVFKELGCDTYGYDIVLEISKNSFEECLQSNIIFLALPTPYNSSTKSFELSYIKETLQQLRNSNYKGVVVLKSTLVPGSTLSLIEEFKSLTIIHNPEFLKAKSAKTDFRNQSQIILGYESQHKKSVEVVKSFYQHYFPNTKISLCKTQESESIKIFLNSFYAVKIQYFNELYLTCQKVGMDFSSITQMMINNNRVNPSDTNVPGPDGKLSYGGYCYPKDTNALNEFMKKNNIPNEVLNACIQERNNMREDNDNII